MHSTLKKLFRLLDAAERRRAGFVFVLMVLVALSEVMGVASIMPFIAVLSNPSVISTNKYLAQAYELLGFTSDKSFLVFLGALFFGLLVGSLSLKTLGAWVQIKFTNDRNLAWSARLVSAYLNQPYEWSLRRHSGELSARILNEVGAVVHGALVPAMLAVAQALVAAFLLILLVAVDPVLALTVGLVLAGGYVTISLAFRRRLATLGSERDVANRNRFITVQEAFGGFKQVKISGLERNFVERFWSAASVMAQRQTASGLIWELPGIAMQALLFGGMILVLLYLIGVHGGLQQALPVVALYAFAGYRLMPAIHRVYEETSKLRFADAALNALTKELADLGSSPIHSDDDGREARGLERLRLRENLSLVNVTYRYPGAERLSLDSVTIDVPAFHSVGLVGATGSGKTTLVDVVLALLRPASGRVLVDGKALRGDLVRSWQKSLGYVPQDIYLADEAVAGNIAFGVHPDQIDMAAVERAAKIAKLHDFVVSELPAGYQTLVGERGVRLSGGQRQRIAIARALYHDPDVLILDEATSALDNVTEHAVMDAVNNLARRKTIILIAHRLTTVRNCDYIYVLDQGRVIGSGTYDSLMAENSHFRRMVESA